MVANASSTSDGVDEEHCQYMNNRNYNYQSNNFPTHYHPRLRNHENFSSGNPRNALQPLLGFNQSMAKKKSSLEDLMSTFIVETKGRFNKDEARLDNLETHCSNMGTTMMSLEVQIGQLASSLKAQQSGNFPSDTEKNPKDHCKAITLRSGKEIEGSKPWENKTNEEKTIPEPPKENAKPYSIAFLDNPPIITPRLPYPQRFQKKKLDS